VSNQSDPPSGNSRLPGVADPQYAADVRASCASGGPEQLPDPLTYGADVGGAVKAITRATEHIINRCGCDTKECIANALDNYADALARLSPQLPLELRNLPDVVATAARRVRAAHTSRQAVQALNVAVAAVHKTIALLRADDPATLKAETREGAFVAETLQVASIKLERASGI
jgi:hypothetical protein